MSLSTSNPVMKGHLLSVLRTVQFGFFLAALSTLYRAIDAPSIALVIKSMASLGGAVLLFIAVHLAKNKCEDLAVTVFLLISVTTLFLLVLSGGGMYSISMIALPLALVFSSLFAPPSTYLTLFVSMFVGILIIGLNDIYGWFVVNGINGFGAWSRLQDGVLIILVSGYATWVVGRGLKQTFNQYMQKKAEVVKAKSEIQRLANTDSLTGLLNRESSKYEFKSLGADIKRATESIALYFIDLDHFKSINDLFDHSAGDALLVTVANRLKKLGDENTFIGRLGGDEFIVFQRTLDSVSSYELAEEIREVISQPHNILGAPAQVTASIGVTKVKSANFDQACKEADMAMYKVKHAKRNGYQFYSKALQREYMTSVNVVHGLQNAVQRKVLEFRYQPKVDLKTGEILGVEALIRWIKQNPNEYGPEEFMPIVESTELVHEIGQWTIQEACRVCSEWHKQGHKISMAINVSPMQLAIPGFYQVVKDALDQSGLDPNYLEIELTEHLLIKEKRQFNHQLQRLKSLGVCLAIDDFGTGYSNLGYLTELRVDVLKLDRSFIVQMADSKSTLAVIKAIIGMARVLKLKVVAEGVETEQELKQLAEMGCDIGQGFLWSKPVTSLEVTNLLLKNSHLSTARYDKITTLG